MSKVKNKFLVFALTLVMALGVFAGLGFSKNSLTAVYAQSAQTLNQGIVVTAGGVKIGSSEAFASSETLAQYGLAFDISTATLTMTNATIEASDNAYYGIYSEIGLNLVLSGENKVFISKSDMNNDVAAVWVNGNLTVSGTGSLIADENNLESGHDYGLYVYGKLSNSATITGIGYSYGVYCKGLENTAGTLTGISNNHYGLYNHDEKIIVSGGTVVGRGHDSFYDDNGGIIVSGNGKIVANNKISTTGEYSTTDSVNCLSVSGVEGKQVIKKGEKNIGLNKKEGAENIEITVFKHADHNEIEFTPWVETTSLPTSAGNYVLACDVTISATWSVPEGTTNLCLNGHVIFVQENEFNKGITIDENAILNLYDCNLDKDTPTSHNGYFVGTDLWCLDENNEHSGESKKTIFGGIIVGSQYITTGGAKVAGTFNMFGGTIAGFFGGGVKGTGTFNMFGGSIIGNGGGRGVNVSDTFNMFGGSITGNDGGVNVSGTFNMFGGSITGNRSGGVDVGVDGSMTVGGTANITGNGTNNLFLPKDKTISLGTDENAPITTGDNKMQIGIDLGDDTGDFITNSTNGDCLYCFMSDAGVLVLITQNADTYTYSISENMTLDPRNGEDILTTMPDQDPTWTGKDYVFAGWYDAKINGEKGEDHFNANKTHYAHWWTDSSKTTFVLTEDVIVKSDGLYVDNTKIDDLSAYGLVFENGILTIENAVIESRINSQISLTLTLIGDNQVNSTDGVAVEVNGNLTVNGDGTLVADGGSSNGVNVTGTLTNSATITGKSSLSGVYVTNSLTNNGTITGEGSDFGVYVGENITNSATITGESSAGDAGIYFKKLNNTAGTLTGISSSSTGMGLSTPNTYGEITVSGGIVEGQGGKYGIWVYTNISVSGNGKIIGKGGSRGIVLSGKTSVSDNGVIEGQGSEYGLDANQDVIVSGNGKIVANKTIRSFVKYTTNDNADYLLVTGANIKVIEKDSNEYKLDKVGSDDIVITVFKHATHNEIKFTPWVEATSLPTTAGNYVLACDVTLFATWEVPEGTTNLCLNGHVINANGGNFSVITIPTCATLNLYDCDLDKDTPTSYNGYVDSNGLWHLGEGEGTAKAITGGIITGAIEKGVDVIGTFNMSAGTITGNQGGGVYNAGTMVVGGTAQITDNGIKNLFLPKDKTITIGTKTQTDDGNSVVVPTTMSIGITLSNNVGAFTNAGIANYSANFFSDNSNYSVYVDNKGTESTEDDVLALGYVITNNCPQEQDDVDGYITLDKTVAAKDDTVTIIVMLKTGYKLTDNSLKATYNDGSNDIECVLTLGANNTYTFTMPAFPVVITAGFEAKETISITETAQEYDYNGSAIPFAIQGTSLTGFTVQYYVGETWTTAPTTVGSYKIKITRAEDGSYKAYAKEIANGLVINKATNTWKTEPSISDKTYDGKVAPLTYEATLGNSTATIKYFTSQDVELEAAPTNAGSYKVTVAVAGTDNYTELTKTLEFKIEKAQAIIDITNVVTTYTYNGKEQSVTSGATLNHNETTLNYTDNKFTDVGTGTYTITISAAETDNYESVIQTVKITVNKAPLTITAKDKTIKYDENPANDGVTYIGFVNEETSAVLGGTLAFTYSYEKGNNVGEYAITPKGLTSSNYEITFANGKLTVEQKSITGATVVYDESKVYNGETQTFAVTSVTIDGLTATFDVANNTAKDYSENGYVLTITGNGNFTGIIEKTFRVTKANYDMRGIIFENATYSYDGAPKVLVISGTLPSGVSVFYTTNTLTNVGSLEVTATFTGDTNNYNLIENKTATLTITPKDIAGAEVVYEDSKVYNGQTQTFAVTSVIIDGEPATFDVTNNTAKDYKEDVYTLTITGNGNFTGTISKTFTITKATNEILTLSLESWNYGETPKTPTATAKFGDIELVYSKLSPRDFSITTLPTEAGNYIVKAYVVGNDNYDSAYKELEFSIIFISQDKEGNPIENPQISIVDSGNAIPEGAVFVVETIDMEDTTATSGSTEALKDNGKLANNEKVYAIYDAELLIENAPVQPNGNIKLKMQIPEELLGKQFKIYHIHTEGTTKEVIEINNADVNDEGYVTFETNKLSQFAFVAEDPDYTENTNSNNNNIVLIISLSAIVLVATAVTIFFVTKKKKGKNK